MNVAQLKDNIVVVWLANGGCMLKNKDDPVSTEWGRRDNNGHSAWTDVIFGPKVTYGAFCIALKNSPFP
jgi:hypothetical protein